MNLPNTPETDFPEEINAGPQSVWATIVPYRRPKFKAHKNLSEARSAMTCHYLNDRCALYKLVDGKWVRELLSEPPSCHSCGARKWLRPVDPKKVHYTQPHICYECQRKSRT